jgi:A/G-specific adenine glycosylase
MPQRYRKPLDSPTVRARFRRALLRWFARNGRDLPWRHTHNPYAVLVSEFMLQQTQVATVIPFYQRWLERFPHFAALAAASENDVLHAWQGLGYYARARNLHAAVKMVQDRHHGKFPRQIEAMRALPGFGRYTANAVATFAFDQGVPIVEANTARVLARVFNSHTPIDSARGREALWTFAADLLPEKSARIHNSALMDLGALVCLPRPKCCICPVRRFCCARNPALLPRKRTRPTMKQLTEQHAFVWQNEKVLLEQASRRWRGMWILPCSKLGRLNRSGFDNAIYRSVFSFTHHRIRLLVHREGSRRRLTGSQRWIPVDALDCIPIPSPHRRAIVDLVKATRAGLKRRRQS